MNGASFIDINFAYGFACAFGVYVSAAASGTIIIGHNWLLNL